MKMNLRKIKNILVKEKIRVSRIKFLKASFNWHAVNQDKMKQKKELKKEVLRTLFRKSKTGENSMKPGLNVPKVDLLN